MKNTKKIILLLAILVLASLIAIVFLPNCFFNCNEENSLQLKLEDVQVERDLLKDDAEKIYVGKKDVTYIKEQLNIIAFNQEKSISDKQEMAMSFQESMGLLYSYLVDVNELEPEKDFTKPIVIYDEWDKENDLVRFKIGFIINKNVALREGMEIIVINPSKVIKKSYKGEYNDIEKTHNAIKDYVKRSSLKINSSPYEVFVSEPSVSSDKKITEVYYPIQ